MAQLPDPITQRDFSAGRIAKSAVATALMPNYSSHSLTSAINSVANSINVDYSEIIGSAIVRKGKQDILQITSNMVDGEHARVTTSGSDPKVEGSTLQAQLFTPQTGESATTGIAVKLYRTGADLGPVTVSLNTTTSSHPNNGVVNGNSWTFDAGFITSTPTVYIFPTSPNTNLTVGTVYAIVMQYPTGDSSNYISWVYDTSGVYLSGNPQTSTNGGSSWVGNPGANYFAQLIADPSTLYNHAPLGNYSFLFNSQKKNVVAFDITDSVISEGAIFYYDINTSTWKISNVFNLSPTAKVRFANLNKYVFEVNGVQVMKSSTQLNSGVTDIGHTWTTDDCIYPYDISTAQTWDSSITYAVGNLVIFGGTYYISIQQGSNEQPDMQPTYWTPLSPLIPSLIIVSSNRMLVSGVSQYPSRVYFSSLVDPNSTIFITWNTDPTAGDWFDIDPDTNGIITAFANTSTLTLIFKTNGMYRIATIANSVNAEFIFNVGCVSQEALTSCLGLVYFYSGDGIYSTDGTFPQNISRIGVQDYIDAISDPQQVYAWADEFNVYFSLGAITITFGPEDKRTYSNVVLKFSPRDQNWQIFTYNQYLAQTSQFGLPPASLLATEYSGAIATVNSNTISDDGGAIPYEMDTQEQEFGDRSHTKNISDKIVVFARNGNEGSMSVKENDGAFLTADMTLENRINVGTDVNFEGQFFTFRWKGEALGSRPVFEGYHLPTVTDLGITQNDNAN